MALATLAYVSEAARGIALKDLKHILRRSREHNFRGDVTGYLVFDGVWFAQLLEGTPEMLDEIMARITADPRHHDLRLLLRQPVAERCFEDWCMGCTNLAAPVHLDTSELRGLIKDFVGQRELPLGEVQAFFRTFAELRTPQQAALLTL